MACYGERNGIIAQGNIIGSGDILNAYWILKDSNGNDSIANVITLNAQRYEGLSAGKYKFYFQDVYGCQLEDSVTITQPDMLEISTSQDSTVCYLPKGSVSVQVQGGTTPYSYVWTNKETGAVVGNQSIVDRLDTGYYKVQVKDKNNCQIEDSIRVLSTVLPHIDITQVVRETCAASNGSLTIDVKQVKAPVTYTWSPNPSGSTGATLSNVKGDTYHVHIADVDGCQADTSIEIPSVPTPMVQINGPTYLCNDVKDTLRTETLRSVFVQHEWGGVTYDGTSIGTIVGNILPITKAGTYWVKSLDTVNCYAYDTIHITHLSPSVNISHSDVLCYGERSGEILQGAITGGGAIQTAYWVLKDISGGDSIVNAEVSGRRYEQLGAGSYRFYSQDEYRCELFDTVVISQPDPLRDTISQDSTVCYLPKGLVSVQVQGGTTPYGYVWTNKETGVVVGNQSIVERLDTGYYKVEVIDSNRCELRDSIRVYSTGLPQISITGVTDETCDNSNGSVTVNVSQATSPIVYTWTPNPSGSTGATLSNVKGDTYHVHIIDVNGCQADTSIEIGAYPNIVVTGSTTPEICHRSNGTISVKITSDKPNTVAWVWTSPSGSQMSDTSTNLTSLQAGRYVLTVTDTLCRVQQPFDVAHIDGPTADFEANAYSIALNTELKLIDESVGKIRSWVWSFGDSTTATGALVYHRYEEEGTYKVWMQVTDDNACTDTISKIIHAFFDDLNVYIPNTFTPNGDGLNDTWGPIMRDYTYAGYQVSRISIYDRWGNRVFTTEDPHEQWDGTVNGRGVAPNTVFSYIIVITDKYGYNYEYSGHVTVLR